MVFQITELDIEYSTLDQNDLGKWGYLVSGCYQLFDTIDDAEESYNEVFSK